MKPKIFIAKKLPSEIEQYIAEHCDYSMWKSETPLSRQQLFKELADVDGYLTSGGMIDQELLDHAPKLKVISNISVGYNNFDIPAMKLRKIMGTNTPGVLNETVADLVLGLMLAAARRIPALDRYVKEGKWKRSDAGSLFGWDVHHATLGIIGMGRIGEAIAKRAKFGFEMKINYFNRSHNEEAERLYDAQFCSLEQLLKTSDFVVLMTPLTPETEHFIRLEHFQMMKRTAFFINASRGQTVDEKALIEALQTELIRGAGLDVFEQEPIDPINPLLTMNNVVTMPHIGSATAQTRFDMAMHAAHNIVVALKGERPPSLIKELEEV